MFPENRTGAATTATAAEDAMQQLRKLSKAQTMLVECNRALARSTEEQGLFEAVCRILAGSGSYTVAWIGIVEHDAHSTIRPAAHVNAMGLDFSTARVSWADNEFGRGPAGRAIRSGTPQVARNVATDPNFAPWRSQTHKLRLKAALALPVRVDGGVAALLSVNSDQDGAFDSDEIALLAGLAEDIGFGVSGLRARQAQRLAEQALRDSEARYRALTTLSADHFWELDANHRVVRIESYGGERVSEIPQSILHKPRWEAGFVNMTEADWQAHRATLDAKAPFRDLLLKWIHSTGEAVWLSLSGHAAYDAAGRFIGYRGLSSNVTERVRSEALQKMEHEVSRVLAESESTAVSLRQVMQVMCETLDWDCGRYFQVQPDGATMRLAEHWARDDPEVARYIEYSRDLTFTPGKGLSGRAWQSREPVWSTDKSTDSRMMRTGMPAFGGRGGFVLPVISGGEVLGVISLSCEVIREPDERLLRAVRVVGAQIGQFLGRKQAEEEMRRFRVAMDNSADMIVLIERESMRFVDVNATVCKLLGYSREEMLALGPHDILPLGRDALERAYDQLIADGSVIGSMKSHYRRKDGTLLPFESTRHVLQSGGKHLIAAISRDVSERMAADEALRRSEANFRSLIEQASDGIFVATPDGRLILANSRYCEMVGYEQEELLRLHVADTYPEEEQAQTVQRLATQDKVDARVFERRMRRKDGTLFPVEVSVRQNDEGLRHGIVRDITGRHRAQKVLQLEHAVARSLAEADNVATGLRAVLRSVCESEGWECGRYFALDEAARVLRFTEGWCTDDPVLADFMAGSIGLDSPWGVGLIGSVWQAGEPLWVPDCSLDARSRRGPDTIGLGVHGAFLFPVRFDDNIVGVFCFISREVRQPDERLLKAVEVIGNQIGQFLGRKVAEQRIREQALWQRLIADFSQHTLANLDMNLVCRQALELVSTTLRVERAEILRLDETHRQLVCMGAVGWPADWPGYQGTPLVEGGAVEQLLARRAPLVLEDYAEHPRYKTIFAERRGLGSGIQMPIKSATGVFGLFNVHMLHRRRFNEGEVSFLESISNVLAVAIERSSAQDKLAYLAQFDSLTGLPNRHLFHDRLAQSIAHAKRTESTMAVLFIDLDRFKMVNDTLGHAAGDKLLREAARRLSACVRSSDTVGRLGGDEFAATLLDLNKPGDAGLVGQKIIDALAQPFQLDGREAYVSASVGITLYPADSEDAAALIMNADSAMYRAKEQGRSNYQYFTREMNERALQRASMETQLRRALERNEYVLHYQPRVGLKNGAISGFEALLRWNHPERGLVSPVEFIPVLEDTGLIIPVGEWVLRAACLQIVEWRKAGLPTPPIAVNLSARQFQQKDLEASVSRVLHETGVDASLIQFEITESLLMNDPDSAARTLRALSDSGVKLSVDDFGTGYSSLSYLKRFPLDALKIDRTFVRDITADTDDAAITLAIINLAHTLGLEVVAEGVETRAQLEFLALHGCDEMQGFYFSKAVPAGECAVMLSESRRLDLDAVART
jgi:diguanylate cyclase (GGDEF)-like protein/PAS domain S-box-containing protein